MPPRKTGKGSPPGDPDKKAPNAGDASANIKGKTPGARRRYRKAILPPRVAEILGRELARSWTGAPALTVTAARVLYGALRPLEEGLAGCLAPCERLPDGSLQLLVPRSTRFQDAYLPAGQLTVRVRYDLHSGRWISDVASGQPGFARLAAHVWRLKGGSGMGAETYLFALIGAAYLYALSEEAV